MRSSRMNSGASVKVAETNVGVGAVALQGTCVAEWRNRRLQTSGVKRPGTANPEHRMKWSASCLVVGPQDLEIPQSACCCSSGAVEPTRVATARRSLLWGPNRRGGLASRSVRAGRPAAVARTSRYVLPPAFLVSPPFRRVKQPAPLGPDSDVCHARAHLGRITARVPVRVLAVPALRPTVLPARGPHQAPHPLLTPGRQCRHEAELHMLRQDGDHQPRSW